MQVVGEIKSGFHKYPGVQKLNVLLLSILGLTYKNIDDNLMWSTIVFGLCILLFFMSGVLDVLMFDPLFSSKRLNLSKSLDKSRVSTSQHLKSRTGTKGLYKSCKKIVSAIDKWDGRIKTYVDISKMFRMSISLYVIICVSSLLKIQFVSNGLFTMLSKNPILSIVLKYHLIFFLIITIGYILFRILHMKELYEQVRNLNLQHVNIAYVENIPTEEALKIGDKIVLKENISIYERSA